MSTDHVATGASGHHAHDVSLDDTFDFLNTDNTKNGFPFEMLPTLDTVLEWFVRRGVIHGEGADRLRTQAVGEPGTAVRELARVHGVRGAMREVANAVIEQRAPRSGALDTVNRALHARQVIELVTSPDGVTVDHRHVGDPIDDALARLADPFVTELTAGHPEDIKTCASETCFDIFFDTSRTGKRRWCDMSVCGNRAKAARHRARAKGTDAARGGPENPGDQRVSVNTP